jgi:hypothetical protein
MCQVGGPRCYAGSKQASDKSEAAYAEATAGYFLVIDNPASTADEVTAARDAREAAHQEMRDRMADLASSPKGHAELRQRMGSTDADWLPSHRFMAVLDEGEFRRDRGALVRKIRTRPYMDDLTGLVGKTGDPAVDEIVQRAAWNVSQAPDRYPGWDHQLPDPSPFDSPEQKDTLVRAWESSVRGKAEAYETARRRTQEAMFDVALTDYGKQLHPDDAKTVQRFKDACAAAREQEEQHRRLGADLVMTAKKFLDAQNMTLRTVAA